MISLLWISVNFFNFINTTFFRIVVYAAQVLSFTIFLNCSVHFSSLLSLNCCFMNVRSCHSASYRNFCMKRLRRLDSTLSGYIHAYNCTHSLHWFHCITYMHNTYFRAHSCMILSYFCKFYVIPVLYIFILLFIFNNGRICLSFDNEVFSKIWDTIFSLGYCC